MTSRPPRFDEPELREALDGSWRDARTYDVAGKLPQLKAAITKAGTSSALERALDAAGRNLGRSGLRAWHRLRAASWPAKLCAVAAFGAAASRLHVLPRLGDAGRGGTAGNGRFPALGFRVTGVAANHRTGPKGGPLK